MDPITHRTDNTMVIAAENNASNVRRKIPLVYHRDYDICFRGIPFTSTILDSKRFAKIFKTLVSHYGFNVDDIYEPAESSQDELLSIHSKQYLSSVSQPVTISKMMNLYLLSMMPETTIDRNILYPMRLATGGTVLASALAIQYGWSVNLSGGYHNAKTNSGQFTDIYADVPLAIRMLLKDDASTIRKVLIVDLDASFGSGYQTLFALHDEHENESDDEYERLVFTDDERIHIFDMYNSSIGEVDRISKQFLTYGIPLHDNMEDEEYILKLENHFPPALRASSPDIVFFNAGVNVHMDHHKVGGLCLSTEGVVYRDEYVFRICRENDIPIVMVLSSCSSTAASDIVVASLDNLHSKNLISLRTW